VNACAGEFGTKLGKTDQNIREGMRCEDAVDEMVKAIYMGEKEYIVSNIAFHKIAPVLVKFSSFIEDKFGAFNYKQQKAAIEKGE